MQKFYNRRTDRRVGEKHWRVRVPDADVQLMRTLHQEHGLGYTALSRKFDQPRSTVRDICKYYTRG